MDKVYFLKSLAYYIVSSCYAVTVPRVNKSKITKALHLQKLLAAVSTTNMIPVLLQIVSGRCVPME